MSEQKVPKKASTEPAPAGKVQSLPHGRAVRTVIFDFDLMFAGPITKQWGSLTMGGSFEVHQVGDFIRITCVSKREAGTMSVPMHRVKSIMFEEDAR